MANYISRDAAIEALCKAHSPYPRRREISVRAIQEIPAADVRENVRGEWIDVQPAPFGMLYATCSYCAMRFTIEPDYKNFCSNCGADMRERKETK